jgi:hypothetical protein
MSMLTMKSSVSSAAAGPLRTALLVAIGEQGPHPGRRRVSISATKQVM